MQPTGAKDNGRIHQNQPVNPGAFEIGTLVAKLLGCFDLIAIQQNLLHIHVNAHELVTLLAQLSLEVNPISPTKVLNHIDSWEVHRVMKWTTFVKKFQQPLHQSWKNMKEPSSQDFEKNVCLWKLFLHLITENEEILQEDLKKLQLNDMLHQNLVEETKGHRSHIRIF